MFIGHYQRFREACCSHVLGIILRFHIPVLSSLTYIYSALPSYTALQLGNMFRLIFQGVIKP